MSRLEYIGEESFQSLTDGEALKERKRRAELKYKDLSQTRIGDLRTRMKTDLFFLANLLGYTRLSPLLHGHLCSWMAKTTSSRYRNMLMPRNHYKTTVCTICDSVQRALPADGLNLPYQYMLGSNVKLLIAHEVRESASRMLFEIASAFMANELMLILFPELVPEPRKHRVNKWELELPRDSREKSIKEPTFDTIGAAGSAQGRHYDWLKLDDLIGEDARESVAVMERTINWFDNINSLLTRPKHDGWDLIGTF